MDIIVKNNAHANPIDLYVSIINSHSEIQAEKITSINSINEVIEKNFLIFWVKSEKYLLINIPIKIGAVVINNNNIEIFENFKF